MSEYTINHGIDGWPICKNGGPIFSNKAMLAELHQLQAHVKGLEAIYLGLTKTLVEMEAEKAKLVEALQAISRNELDAQRAQHVAAVALAAHRKQGGER